jgi:hypothetical protein
MIQEIMNMSTDEIKEIFDHTKNVDSKNVHVHGIFPFESNPGERRSRMAKIGRNTFYEERERRFCI